MPSILPRIGLPIAIRHPLILTDVWPYAMSLFCADVRLRAIPRLHEWTRLQILGADDLEDTTRSSYFMDSAPPSAAAPDTGLATEASMRESLWASADRGTDSTPCPIPR